MFKKLMTMTLLTCCLTPATYAAELKLAVGLALPPYVISENSTGMELDIVRESLAFKGHTVKIKYYPFIRILGAIKESDAVLTVNESSGMKNVHYSQTHMTYQNVAVALQKNNIAIGNVPALKDYSVMAFQNAKQYLGDEFAAMAKGNKKYKEKAQQDIQVRMLYSNRVEVVVLDNNIFKYYKNLEKKADASQKITTYKIFDPSEFKVAFVDKNLRDDFDLGLAELKSSGRYQEIIDSYIK